MTGDQSNYDIVIAGGGMIGTSLALALAPLGLRIAVVEAVARRESQQPSFDDRSTALSRSTQRTFEAMGLWEEVVAASTPIKKVHVSDKGRFGFSHIDAEEQGVEALGYVVINRVLGDVLQQHLESAANIDVLCPLSVASIQADNDSMAATLSDGQAVHAKLLVGADGANSSVRDMLGISVQRREYQQRAVVGNLQSELAHDNRAFERFTPAGPLAILPLAEQRCGFVWTVLDHDADRVLALHDAEFIDELQEQFGLRLGRFTKVGTRAAYPLMLSKAVRLIATRSVLIGNAAHGLHPVAAQGFNLGMRDVAALCDCIVDQLKAGADVGDSVALDRYAAWRKTDQQKLVHFTDNLVRLFGSTKPGVSALRDIGMLGFDLVPGVRSLFAKHTMGLAGELPRLSRGMPIQ